MFGARPDERTFRFLVDGEGEPLSLTNAELDRRAQAVATTLRQRFPAGERALIVCPPGLDYIVSFFACLYSGIIAVPVYPPDPSLLQRTLPRLLGVIEDAEPVVVLAPAETTALADRFAEYAPALRDIAWQAVDTVDPAAAQEWRRPDITAADLAFLQYTSGSTSRPKGVMVGHGNLIHNLRQLNTQFFDASADSHMVTWLPPYHDMGLIAGLLAPVFGGYPVTFMSPFSFLKRPYRWLKAVSDHGGTLGGGPNFAFDLCAAKVSEQELETLDLSTWRVALNGAEPVRMETIDKFSRTFAPTGFRRETFMPAYGLAEGTLAVSGGDIPEQPVFRRLDPEALAADRAVDAGPEADSVRTVVGCGWSLSDQRIVIADPRTRQRLPEGRVGEIWVAGDSIAHGYWRRAEITAETFDAHLEDTGEGPFLRTGDLGFLDGTELYVTGRIKDVIIVAGQNHYPQDIERTVEAADTTALRAGCGVAGIREIDGVERLIVIQEVAVHPGRFDAGQVIAAIQARVAEEHGLPVHGVALVRRGTVPKTSSGKLQRNACLNAFVAGELKIVAGTGLPEEQAAEPEPEPAARPDAVGRDRVETLLRAELAKLVGTPAAELDPTRAFASYGLRSVDLVALVGELERLLDRRLESTVVWEYPTVEQLADFLGAETPGATGAIGATTAEQSPEQARTEVTEPAAEREPAADGPEPVAIVGIGCRFPGGVHGPDAFWQLLREGRDAVTEVPAQRWDVADYTSEDPAAPGRTNSKWGGFLDRVDEFDLHFFGISPQEAARMDPQQRLLAEVCWEALEDAGLPAERLAGSATGVFVGISSFDYANMQLRDLRAIDAYTGTGSALSVAANRLSYLFDLRGPSMAVDTACSSSLVAVLQACASLSSGECGTAIAAGVNLVLSPAFAINFSKAGAMSPDGRCKPFDSRANGYVRSEGAGVVVLKPLSKALADRDPVYGVIRGGAVTQDGRSNGIMAPNPQAQEAVLRTAYARAGVRPEQVHYVEAHGTGTMLGDPIEAKALAAVLGTGRSAQRPLLLGSVKSNLGHMEAAAGIGGLIKAALMVRHRTIPASLHYRQPNPHIPFDELGLRVADTLQPWPETDGPALAGISSFGFGGTNAHLVLEQPPEPPPPDAQAPTGAWPLALSARTEDALRELVTRYQDLLAEPGREPDVAALSFASTVRRSHHEFRLACVGDSPDAFLHALAAYRAGEEAPGLSAGGRRIGRRPKVAFVFSGQGPRWWPLAADLLETEPVFRDTLQRCDALLRKHTDWSLLDRLTAPAGEDAGLAETAVWQPALCAVQVALAALWRSWGVQPSSVLGHSVGEIAAAYVAGALSLENALLVALHRGRVLESAAGKGRMAMAGVGVDRAREILAERKPGAVWVAASNSPHSTVLSGEAADVESLAAALEADGIYCRVLESVGFASHSPLMEPVAGELWPLLTGIRPRATAVPMLSTVTGEEIEGERLDAEYWAENLSSPVLFDRAVTALAESGHEVFVELSPHPMLGDSIAERLSLHHLDGVAVSSLRRDEPGRAALLGELGRLYTAGFPLDWAKVLGRTGPMTPLPGYPWQRERCWLESGRGPREPHDGHPALETRVRSAAEPHPVYFTARIDLTGQPYLDDHRVGGSVVLPASFVLDAALAAARQALGADLAVLEDVEFTRMTVVPGSAEQATVQLVLDPETAEAGSFRLFSRTGTEQEDQEWAEAARGRFRRAAGPEPEPDTLTAARDRCQRPVETATLYTGLRQAGLEYGPAFQGMQSLWGGEGEAVAQLRHLSALTPDTDPYLVHPALLDSCLQALVAALGTGEGELSGTYLPVRAGRFTLTGEGAPGWAHATVGAAGAAAEEIPGCAVTLFDESGQPLGQVTGITLRRLDRAQGRDPVAEAMWELSWQQAPESTVDVEATEPGRWLLLADDTPGGLGERLRAELERRSGTCVTVTPGERYQRLDDTHYLLDPYRAEDFTALLADLAADGAAPCAGVVHALGLTAEDPEGTGDTGYPGGERETVSALHLVQAIAGRTWEQPPRLVLLTRGAQRTGEDDPEPAMAQAPLSGLARVITLEHGELRPTAVDLDPAAGADEAALLAAELLRPEPVEQVALRGGDRYLPRLEPWTAPEGETPAIETRPLDPGRDGNYQLLALRPGILDSLTPTLCDRVPPGPGEVQVEVAAAGLNFSDVLKALDVCPGVPPGIGPLGAECAGRISALGEGVHGHRVGDPVMVTAPAGMSAYVTVPAQLAAPRPEGLTDEQAAAVPIAFLTAVYGLEYLARLRAGEKVLIHSATGGVGLAALMVARRRGAEVFATAGTEAKRELLRSMGIRHVMDSRSLRFAEEITELTGGRGVDVVLNSTAGEALVRSLALLAPGGRFVEIGKRDIYDDNRIGLGHLKHNRSFFAVDLERSIREEHELVAELFREVCRGFAAGEFDALPVHGYPYTEAAAAFSRMAKAQHTGKLVLVPDTTPEVATRRDAAPVRAAATYLITGGLGALGLRTARYLAEQGARHLVLLGRSEPSTAAAAEIGQLRACGVQVLVRSADVSRYAEVAEVFAELDDPETALPPLAGVVHAAGVLDDGLLLQLDRQRFRTVAEPKAAAAWHLHRATLDRRLDFFVLYSSAAALLGSASQGNYAAANAFLDALAQHRRARGLPALSVNWGPWAEIGLAAEPDRGGALSTRGVLSLAPADGIEALDRLLRTPATQACVLPLDIAALRAGAGSGMLPALLAHLAGPAATPENGTGGPEGEFRRRVLAVEPGRRRRALFVEQCVRAAAKVLKQDEAKIDPTAPLASMGFDSLLSLELRKRMESAFQLTLPATLTWRFPTIDALVPYLAEAMEIELTAAPPAAAEPEPQAAAEAAKGAEDTELDLDGLSESELEALLLAKTKQIDEGR
ncbi:type I polyketide synthase [Amycolatopsis aidingensis]|uniref:type I polyketide synthase n=1 Tax=Amycolatopsis aidingensis TaxID=2842453 RepID=UPI001C0CF5AC|nr:type I polyketide synthase [Amycolatopsis aidingensis]